LENVVARPGIKRKGRVELREDGNALVVTSYSKGSVTVVPLTSVEVLFQMPGGIHMHLSEPVQMWGAGKEVLDVQLMLSANTGAGGGASPARGGVDTDLAERARPLLEFLTALSETGAIEESQIVRGMGGRFEGKGPKKDMCDHLFMGPYLLQVQQTPFTVLKSTAIGCLVAQRLHVPSTTSFDLAIVRRDFTWHEVDNVEKSSYQALVAWSRTHSVERYFHSANLVWKKIVAAVQEDPKEFAVSGWAGILDTDMTADEVATMREPTAQSTSTVAYAEADKHEAHAGAVAAEVAAAPAVRKAYAPDQVLWLGMTVQQILDGEGDSEDEDYVPGEEEEGDYEFDSGEDEDEEEQEEEEEEEGKEEAQEWAALIEASGSTGRASGRKAMTGAVVAPSEAAVLEDAYPADKVVWLGMTAGQIAGYLDGSDESDDEDYDPGQAAFEEEDEEEAEEAEEE